MHWKNVVILSLFFSACGSTTTGGSKPSESDPWLEAPKDFWKAPRPTCPDGGTVTEDTGGETRVQACKRNDVEHGPKVVWHKSGSKLAEGLMRDGEVHGRWREWQADGKLVATLEFKDGELHGKASRTDPSNRHLEEHYRLGKLDGQRTLKSDKGVILHIEHYQNGKLHGKQTEFHDNGKPRLIATYTQGKPDGEITRLNADGKTLGTTTIKAGTGLWLDWFEDGTKAVETELENGAFHGGHKQFYPNGQPKVQGQYQRGKESGKWVSWSPEGVILSATEYLEGLPQSVATYTKGSVSRIDSYYGNGRRRSSTGYEGGKVHGPAVTWREDGTRNEQGDNKAGKKTGSWYRFAEDGTVARVETFQGGKKKGSRAAKEPPAVPTAALEVGIGVCDHYLRRFLSCEKLPAEARAALPDAWEQLAQRKHASARDEVENTCRTASAQWDSQLQTLGC